MLLRYGAPSANAIVSETVARTTESSAFSPLFLFLYSLKLFLSQHQVSVV